MIQVPLIPGLSNKAFTLLYCYFEVQFPIVYCNNGHSTYTLTVQLISTVLGAQPYSSTSHIIMGSALE